MRRRAAISVLTAVLLFLTACGRKATDSIPLSFNDGWLFIRQDSANADKILPGIIPNHKWEEVTLPHSAVIEPLVVTGSQWTGICWYKKVYKPDRRQRHRHTGLLFDGAMHDAIVYLNGAEIARHTGGYLPFYVNLSNDLEYGRENEIMVKLDNRENPHIPPGKPLGELDFLWYSGLYRNVSLYVTDKLHITAPPEYQSTLGGGIITGVRDVSRESATLTLSVHVSNDDHIPRSFRMKNTLLDAAGLEVASSLSELIDMEPGQSQRLETRMIVMQPSLWTPATPFLYTISTELLSESSTVIDHRETRTGIRTVRITPDKGLLLNSEPVRIMGTNRHQEYPYIGYALSDNASYRDAFKIREAGFNLVRCSHYPPAPAFLDACDELGLMVIDAIPGWQFMGDSLFAEASVRDTRMMCRRDRNHPSVVMWESSLNETLMSVSFLARLHQTVKDELPFGNNLTCSWMDTICDVFIPARQHAPAPRYWKDYRKAKPLFICEYGDWEYYAQDAGLNQTEFSDLLPAERNSRQLRG
ncbi:MAG TPA: glycoside hydrolase family 2 TIM barrel-domain containing protein, partial [Bacteroidales bacterium]|nr:glycoside hydrolase family 2 TIM barrel-domain containing protein [Bacteroidales bacterium]